MLRTRLFRLFEEALFLPLVLFLLALNHGVRAAGLEWPYLESKRFWALTDSPGTSAVAALVSVGAIAVLLGGQAQRRAWRLVGVAALLGVATYALDSRATAVTGLWGVQVLLLLAHAARTRFGKPRAAAASPALSGPSASDVLTLGAAVAAVVLAVVITAAIGWASPGLLLPLVSPADRFPYSHRPLAAGVVRVESGGGSSAVLVPHPSLSREQVLAGVRDQGGGWVAGRMLERLDRRKVLGELPSVEPEKVAALLGPAEGSGVLRTREGESATARGLWGVVVEAEHWKGRRRALLSLGLGEPTGLPATRYELLLEWPEGGGAPQVIDAARFVARPSGFEGVEWPGVFLPVLLVCLLLTLGLTLVWRSRRRLDGGSPAAPAEATQG